MAQAALFDQTAENRARNKTILWWVLQLSYEKVGDDYVEVFKGKGFEERLAEYDKFEELEDDFLDEMLKKFSYVVSFWFVTKADTKEQLDVLLNTADEEAITGEKPAEEKQEESKKEESKTAKKSGKAKKAAPEKSKVEKEGA